MLIIIAAHDKNRVIGFQNRLPWHLSEDLRRFKEITMGHALIMGRKTYESIGKPLPGRQNIVVTRNSALKIDGVTIVLSLEEAIKQVPADQKAFVIGGADLFNAAVPMAEELILTLIHKEYEGDVYFPSYEISDFEIVEKSDEKISEKENIPYSYLTLRRKIRK